MRNSFIPYGYRQAFDQAGLTSAEEVVAIWATTRIFQKDGRWYGDWPTAELIELSGKDYRLVWRARSKLISKALIVFHKAGARRRGESDLFDFTKLVMFQKGDTL